MLHRIEANGVVVYASDNFLKELDKAIIKALQEYNTDTSAGHPK